MIKHLAITYTDMNNETEPFQYMQHRSILIAFEQLLTIYSTKIVQNHIIGANAYALIKNDAAASWCTDPNSI